MEAKIKPQDLRIGNYVTQDGELIAGITSNTIHRFDMGEITLEPIPLTEDILVRLGWTKHEKGYFFIHWGRNGVEFIKWMPPYERYGIELGQGKTKVLTYVHELQNGFYFLTSGTELTLNP